MLRRVALVKTEVSEEPSTSTIRVTRIGELGTMLAVTSSRRTLRRNIKKYIYVLSRRLCLGILSGRADYLREWERWITKQLIFMPAEELGHHGYSTVCCIGTTV
jgi:hypothetical protein